MNSPVKCSQSSEMFTHAAHYPGKKLHYMAPLIEEKYVSKNQLQAYDRFPQRRQISDVVCKIVYP